eukprot:16446382-Heterocapsa_arctica.AAC.1
MRGTLVGQPFEQRSGRQALQPSLPRPQGLGSLGYMVAETLGQRERWQRQSGGTGRWPLSNP